METRGIRKIPLRGASSRLLRLNRGERVTDGPPCREFARNPTQGSRRRCARGCPTWVPACYAGSRRLRRRIAVRFGLCSVWHGECRGEHRQRDRDAPLCARPPRRPGRANPYPLRCRIPVPCLCAHGSEGLRPVVERRETPRTVLFPPGRRSARSRGSENDSGRLLR